LTGGTVDRAVRPSHLATSTIEELLNGPVFQGNRDVPKNTGPQVVAESIVVAGTAVTFNTNTDLNASTVQPQAFSATVLDPTLTTGWTVIAVDAARYTATTRTVSLTLHSAPARGVLLRLVVRGTGPAPLLGSNSIALGGSSSSADGQDFAWMKGVEQPCRHRKLRLHGWGGNHRSPRAPS